MMLGYCEDLLLFEEVALKWNWKIGWRNCGLLQLHGVFLLIITRLCFVFSKHVRPKEAICLDITFQRYGKLTGTLHSRQPLQTDGAH